MLPGHDAEIVLVEDNPRDAELAIRALQQRGVAGSVTWLKDGAEALAFVRKVSRRAAAESPRRPRVIILDLKLPKVTGLEVAHHLKADPVTRTIPIVVLSSSQEERDVVESYAVGVNSYIVKPLGFDHFAETVAQAGRYWTRINYVPDLRTTGTEEDRERR
jgi:CheY-like chemotaxis protein